MRRDSLSAKLSDPIYHTTTITRSVLLDKSLSHRSNWFSQYYAPDYELDVRPSNMDNANNTDYLEKIKKQVIENLKRTTFAPSVQMTDVPRDPEGMDDEADAILDDRDEDENMDQRHTKRRWDKYVEKDGELSESEDEEENQRNGVRRQGQVRKRRNMMDFQNAHAVSDDEKVVRRARARSQESEHDDISRPIAATNGSNHSESHTPSPAPSGAGSQGSPPAEDTTMQDADIEMDDDPSESQIITNQLAAEGPQEATPPDSPIPSATATAQPGQREADEETGAMDEGDTADRPETEQDEGLEEREEENVAAEKSTEIAQEREQT